MPLYHMQIEGLSYYLEADSVEEAKKNFVTPVLSDEEHEKMNQTWGRNFPKEFAPFKDKETYDAAHAMTPVEIKTLEELLAHGTIKGEGFYFDSV